MPLTKKGEEALRKFQKQYGKELGESYFYGYMQEHKKITRSWHKE